MGKDCVPSTIARQAPESKSRVMNAFKFDTEDLDANQHGYLSKPQRKKLRRLRRGLLFECLGLSLLIPTVEIVFLIYAIGKSKGLDLFCAGTYVIITMLVSVPIVIVFSRKISESFTKWRGIKFDLYKGDVSAIRGAVYLETFTQGPLGFPGWLTRKRYQIPAYKMQINGSDFSISFRQWDALSEGEHHTHCLYIAPNSKTILSIEGL